MTPLQFCQLAFWSIGIDVDDVDVALEDRQNNVRGGVNNLVVSIEVVQVVDRIFNRKGLHALAW